MAKTPSMQLQMYEHSTRPSPYLACDRQYFYDESFTAFHLSMTHTQTLSLWSAFPQLAFMSYISEMKSMLSDCRTCLDIGCGGGSPTRYIDFNYRVAVEGHQPTLDGARAADTHDEYVLCDAREIGKRFSEKQFDCCVALDLIEHLTKENGLQFIREMERIASKKIVLFTPNGFLPQHSRDEDLQEHLSGWDAREMQSLGFTVVGMHGHRFFRGEYHEHRFKPKIISSIISQASHHLYTRRHPNKAAAILCVKEVGSTV